MALPRRPHQRLGLKATVVGLTSGMDNTIPDGVTGAAASSGASVTAQSVLSRALVGENPYNAADRVLERLSAEGWALIRVRAPKAPTTADLVVGDGVLVVPAYRHHQSGRASGRVTRVNRVWLEVETAWGTEKFRRETGYGAGDPPTSRIVTKAILENEAARDEAVTALRYGVGNLPTEALVAVAAIIEASRDS